MQAIQAELDMHPGDHDVAEAVKDYHYKHKAHWEFLSQKAKHAWIKDVMRSHPYSIKE